MNLTLKPTIKHLLRHVLGNMHQLPLPGGSFEPSKPIIRYKRDYPAWLDMERRPAKIRGRQRAAEVRTHRG
jgi:hypothetical protein